MYQIRREKIREYIKDRRIVSIRELHELCPEVTLMTLHRDLDALANSGRIIKVRGGVRITDGPSGDPSFKSREKENTEQKGIIATKAVGLIREGGSVFFDAGTTTLAVIRSLPDINLTVITNGANFAGELQRFTNVSVYMCCGALNRYNMALSGQSTLRFLETINIDLGFIGVSGYSAKCGFTCGNEAEMLVKKLVIQKARRSVILMDASKLARLMPYTFARLEDIDVLAGDGMLPDDLLRDAAEADTDVL